MAQGNGGLTVSIRRKLQDGMAPEDIVRELATGGMTAVSAQRFVDRALAEHETSPPLPPERSAPVHRVSEPEEGRGRKVLVAVALIVLGAASAGVAYVMGNSEEDVLQMGEVGETSTAPGADYLKVTYLLDRYKRATSPVAKCDATVKLETVPAAERVTAYNGLMATYDDAPDSVKICIAGTIIKLDQPQMAAAIYEGWSHSMDPRLQIAAITGYGELGADYSESALWFLRDQLKSEEWSRRFLVVDSLARMGPGARELLQIAAGDEKREVRDAAAAALTRLQ